MHFPEPLITIGDVTRVYLHMRIDGETMMAEFVRCPDGSISDAASHVFYPDRSGRCTDDMHAACRAAANAWRDQRRDELHAYFDQAADDEKRMN